MISKKKTTKKRHDGTVSFKSEDISIARCQVDARIAEQNKSSTGNDANTNAKKKRSRFVVTSIAESQKSKEVCTNLAVNLPDSCDLTITHPTTDNDNNREIDGLNSQPYVGSEAKKSGSDETRRGARTLERTRKISSVLQPIQSLIELDESRKEPYIVQSLIYCQQHNPLIHLSPAQIIPINLLASNPRRTASHCVLPFDIPFDGRLPQVRDRSVPSLRRSDARLYEKYNVGLATAKENLRRYCLNRMTESSSKSTNFIESSMSVGNRVNSNHEMCQNEGIFNTFTAPIESVTLFSNDCKEMQPIQHCATIVEDQRPEIPLAHLPSLPIASMIISSESQHLPRINTPVNQPRPQQQQPQQKPIAAIDKQKLMLNRRRQSDLGSIAMMQRKIKVNGTTDVINFDDLRERLEQLTGTTCCSNSGVNCSSANKKSVDNKNGAAKISSSSSRSKLTGQGEATPAARNQRHNSIAVVESRDVDRSLDVSIQSQDITTPLKNFPSATSSPCTNLQHSQSTMALSSLVTASTQTNAEIQATPRRHSNDQFNNSPLNFIDPLEVGVLGGSLLDDSLSLDDVVALIHAGEPLYDVTTEDSFWQLLAEGFESGRFQIASKEEANEESLFECSYDEELDKVDVVMVDSAEGATLSDELFQETLARQATERNTTRKRQARERYELHRWYVRHGRPPPRLILESIYFSAFFRKDANKSLASTTSSSSDPSIDETNSVSVVVVPDDDNPKIASESVACSTVSSETVLEHSFEVPRPHGELGLKSMQQQSFSSEDDNYNSIDKHFNRSDDNDAVNFQGLMPPKSPWEVAYNKRAEQLAHLLQQQSKDYHQHQQLKNLQQQQQQSEQQQWPSVADSLPENFMHQLQQLHKKKQQIISLTELLCQQQLHSQQQQQLHSQQQQQQANVVEQLSELLRCQLQQHDPCKSNPFSKHHEHPIGQDFLHRFHQNSTSEHLQRIQEFVANQKFLSENYSHLQPSPCSMVDPRICGSKLSNFDQPNLAASNSPNFNALHDVMAKLNYLQKNRCNFSPSTHKMSKPHPTMLHSPFQPICQEPSFQSINPSSGNLLFSLADRMALDGHPKQDKLCHNFTKSFHPSHDPITSFLSELYGQQNHQQLYYKQHQNLWDQMALLQHLQQPTLGAKQEYLNNLKSQPTTNAMPHGNISKLEEINNVLRGISTNQKIHSALSSDTSDAGSVYADPIQALLASLSSSLKS